MTSTPNGPAHPVADPASVGPGDVLVLRALGLGDTVVAAAPLRGVRRRFPRHRIVVAAPLELGAWLVGEGLADAVLPSAGLAPLPRLGGGHVAVNLHGRGPQSHALLAAGRPARLIAFARPDADDAERWRADEHEVDRWCRLVRAAGGACDRDDVRLRERRRAPADAQVIVHPGAASASRRWPVERWRAVAADLAAGGERVEVTGSADERELAAAVAEGITGVTSRAGRDTVRSLADAVEGAALVVSGDTGIAHLATGLVTPSVTLFGPVPPRLWGAAVDPDLHVAIWHADAATTGAAVTDAGRDHRGGDRDDHGDPHGGEIDPRLADIAPVEVADAAARLLAHARAEPGVALAPRASSHVRHIEGVL